MLVLRCPLGFPTKQGAPYSSACTLKNMLGQECLASPHCRPASRLAEGRSCLRRAYFLGTAGLSRSALSLCHCTSSHGGRLTKLNGALSLHERCSFLRSRPTVSGSVRIVTKLLCILGAIAPTLGPDSQCSKPATLEIRVSHL